MNSENDAKIPEKFLKPYNPETTEDGIYDTWMKSGYFNPDNLPPRHKEPFSIVLPPPNVTGILHMGSALMIAIEDIIVRHARMKGMKTLWIPGTDHAAIATQAKVEKEIYQKEGKRRQDLGRDEFLRRVNEFAKQSHDDIVNQLKKIGASLDWSREAYTLDDARSLAVRTAFKKMYDDGLIYRGNRIVNWDPKGQTTISDDEIVYTEEKTKFYYFQYGPFVIGTARPETKFGDKYIIVHPDDTRYSQYKDGQQIDIEWINGPIKTTVIKDTAIDMTFGTGAMTITPWHSVVDFDIAVRHNLDKEQIIDKYGKLLPVAGEFAGMKISDARPKIVEKLKAKGLLVKEEDYTHNIATAERTGGIIEPQIMNQWFVNVNKKFKRDADEVSLKDLMKKAVEKGGITILPDRFEKVYFHWIDGLRDWCISRQIWFGHRIPVWYRENEVYCGLEAPQGDGWVQDEDTLDTWFSSGLWTFSTLGWPAETEDFKTYHPTTILETGYDIIFFWVARMILMSSYFVGQIPFKTVYLHGIVRDEKGRKISKSLGNNIDPVDMAKKYGADAVRMGLIIGTGPGNDSKVGENKIRGYKNFSNKIWNITRFVLSNTIDAAYENKPELTEDDAKIVKEFDEILKDVSGDMDNFRFYLAGEKLYAYVWHEFADIIIEESKKKIAGDDAKAKQSAQWVLLYILERSLRALHPFMPFVTEEIWSDMPMQDKTLLMISEWPA